MTTKKVHMWVFNQAASDAFDSGVAELDVYINQTKCGYVRELVTTDIGAVTCAHCLRLIQKDTVS